MKERIGEIRNEIDRSIDRLVDQSRGLLCMASYTSIGRWRWCEMCVNFTSPPPLPMCTVLYCTVCHTLELTMHTIPYIHIQPTSYFFKTPTPQVYPLFLLSPLCIVHLTSINHLFFSFPYSPPRFPLPLPMRSDTIGTRLRTACYPIPSRHMFRGAYRMQHTIMSSAG